MKTEEASAAGAGAMNGDDSQPASDGGESGDNARIVLLGAVIIGLSALIGVIVVNASHDDSGGWLYELHQGRFKIRDYWMALMYAATGAVLMIFSIALLVLAGFIWWVFLPKVGRQTSGKTRLVYTLYLAGLAVWPAAMVGIVMAYLDRPADGQLLSHRRLHVRTFWIGVFYWVVGFLFLVSTSRLEPLSSVLGFLVPFVSPVGCLMLVVLSAVVVLSIVWTQPADMVLLDPFGWILMPLAALLAWGLFWWTKRCVRGLRYLSRQEPYPDPETFLW